MKSQALAFSVILLLGTTLSAVKVEAVEVYTSTEIFVENGTRARLPCTFKSSEVVSSRATVSWSFLPDSAVPGDAPFTIFYFAGGQPYPGTDSHFKDRVTWAGDLNKKDASVYIENVQYRDNGTYSCDVKNPPDIGDSPRSLLLRVVAKEVSAQPTGERDVMYELGMVPMAIYGIIENISIKASKILTELGEIRNYVTQIKDDLSKFAAEFEKELDKETKKIKKEAKKEKRKHEEISQQKETPEPAQEN